MIDNNSDRKFFGLILMIIGGGAFSVPALMFISSIFGASVTLCLLFSLIFIFGAWLRYKK
jgi:hypothetical protein